MPAAKKTAAKKPENVNRIYLIDGERYTFDWNVFMGSEASFIQRILGLEVDQWQKGLEEKNYDCILALVALMKRRKDPENISLRDVDLDAFDFDLAKFEVLDEPVSSVAEDPTPAEGSGSSASAPHAAA